MRLLISFGFSVFSFVFLSSPSHPLGKKQAPTRIASGVALFSSLQLVNSPYRMWITTTLSTICRGLKISVISSVFACFDRFQTLRLHPRAEGEIKGAVNNL
jgi:hypothetical protein